MCKGFVRLRHLVHLITFADGITLPLVSLQDLGRQRFSHRDPLASIRKIYQPPQRQCKLPIRRHFERDLVSCAADATRSSNPPPKPTRTPPAKRRRK